MASFQTWTVTEPWLETHCELGEGPFYEKETNTLRFVDLIKKKIITANLNDGPASLKEVQFDVSIGVTSDIEGVDPADRILVGLKYGLAVLNRKDNSYEIITSFNQPRNERLRANDGATDPLGRFWLATMTDFGQGEVRPEGSLYTFSGAGNKTEFSSGLGIPNSVGWSPDNKTLYFTHTTAAHILAYDFDTETGAATNERVFYKHEGSGGIDGFRVDKDGYIWHAIYGESRVIKIDHEGKIVGEIKLPTRNITCVQFAGTELFITSASDHDSGDEVSQRYGGAVFRVDVGTTGLDPFKYKL